MARYHGGRMVTDDSGDWFDDNPPPAPTGVDNTRDGDRGGDTGGSGGGGSTGGGSTTTTPTPPGNTAVPRPGRPGNTPPPATDWTAFDTQVKAWYTQLLGRAATAADLNAHHGNPAGLAGVYGVIAQSAEAKAYADRQKSGGGSTSTGPAPAGYDPAKWADTTHTTTKYEVGRILSKYPKTSAGIQQAMAEITAKYPGATFNGRDTLSGLPGTQGPVDVLTSGGEWWWNDVNAAAAQTNTLGGMGSGATGTGWNWGDTGGTDPYSGFGALLTPWIDNFTYDPFKAPTTVDEQNDPGYKFRMEQGKQAIERSAASHGTLLTGGTLKDLNDYAQQRGSDEYNNVYARSFSDWSTNYQKALGEYRQKYDIYQNNQANIFNRLSSLAGMGQVSATNLGNSNFGSNYSNALLGGTQAYGNYLTQAANAGAAGLVGGANAWTGALGNLGNDALTWAYLTRGSSYGR
jgi:hypothetical protein